ncbi:MAG: hypothetical protein H6819_07155 [Phycisphaerales bacterium]|nr:hypothetical protein [Phycisphaerales bacterium]MCB9857728.1 hypothetical protein [Phycisphaerales bacterium]MCB9863788.1 hypothetical protein [Phycisphaerales bacterium]
MVIDEFFSDRMLSSTELLAAIKHVFDLDAKEVDIVLDGSQNSFDPNVHVNVWGAELPGGEFHGLFKLTFSRPMFSKLESGTRHTTEAIVRGLAQHLCCRIMYFPHGWPEDEALVVQPNGSNVKVVIDEDADDNDKSTFRILRVDEGPQ